jgi:6-pyruvoyltetrahydropterin/6-carboxytetrahydropterin synthase
MYYVEKRLEVSGAHSLTLDYESKCSNLHGHNWIIKIYMKSEELDENGMVMDFTHIKKLISDKLDHKNLNEEFDFNPTAENIAKWICDALNVFEEKCYKVTVQESEGNVATYER